MLTARLTSSPPTRIGSFATCRSVSAYGPGAVLVARAAHHQHELVAAEPGDQVFSGSTRSRSRCARVCRN